ncbi:MAG: hypothetical protein ACRD2A_05245 [Vicinamibacterales bacterium]
MSKQLNSALDAVAAVVAASQRDQKALMLVLKDYVDNSREKAAFIGSIIGMVIGLAERVAAAESKTVEEVLRDIGQNRIMLGEQGE